MIPTRPERSSNRYLQWLDHKAPPPVRGSLGKAEEAVRTLAARGLKARRALARRSSWEELDQLLAALQGMLALRELVRSQSGVSKRMAPGQVDPWLRRWEGWQDRFGQGVSTGAAGATLRRMRRRAPSPARERQLELLERTWQADPALDARMRRLADHQSRRDAAYVRDRKERGGVLVGGKVDGLGRKDHAAARIKAQERGLDGYLLCPWTNETEEACAEADHPELRRLLWLEDRYAPVPMAAVERMRQDRRAKAELHGQADWVHHLFHDRTILRDPRRLEAQIQRARGVLRKQVHAYQDAARRLLVAQDYDIPKGPLTPWDAYFCVNSVSGSLWFDYKKVFPWRETALKVFADLLCQCGWQSVRPARVSGQGVWSVIHFHVRHAATGQESHLLYSPFRPHQTGHDYSAGWAADVINHWAPEGQRASVVWINQTLDPHTQGLTLEDLRVLCHEVGHALHFSAMPGQGPQEIDFLPDDLTELPSYLLELVARDPRTLARWAARKGPAAARRSRFWLAKIAAETDSCLDHHVQLRSSILDLRAHLDMDTPYRDLALQGLVEDGLAMHAEDNDWRRDFIWENSLAGVDFTQTLPRSMVRRLVTLPDNGQSDANTVSATYRELVNQVLIPGLTPQAAGRAWKRWTGESFAASLGLALTTHAHQSVRCARKATAKLRKKAAAIRAQNKA